MALFTRLKRNPPPTTTDYVEAEKRTSAEEDIERVGTGPELDKRRQPHHHDAAAERAVSAIALKLMLMSECMQVVRKLDWRVPVLLGVLYLLSFLDRSNIGLHVPSNNRLQH